MVIRMKPYMILALGVILTNAVPVPNFAATKETSSPDYSVPDDSQMNYSQSSSYPTEECIDEDGNDSIQLVLGAGEEECLDEHDNLAVQTIIDDSSKLPFSSVTDESLLIADDSSSLNADDPSILNADDPSILNADGTTEDDGSGDAGDSEVTEDVSEPVADTHITEPDMNDISNLEASNGTADSFPKDLTSSAKSANYLSITMAIVVLLFWF